MMFWNEVAMHVLIYAGVFALGVFFVWKVLGGFKRWLTP